MAATAQMSGVGSRTRVLYGGKQAPGPQLTNSDGITTLIAGDINQVAANRNTSEQKRGGGNGRTNKQGKVNARSGNCKGGTRGSRALPNGQSMKVAYSDLQTGGKMHQASANKPETFTGSAKVL